MAGPAKTRSWSNRRPARIRSSSYKLGGLTFVIGSVLFFPAFDAYADLGAWTFFAGSLIYLLVTVHDLLEVRQHRRESNGADIGQVLDYIAALSYVWGTILGRVPALTSALITAGWSALGKVEGCKAPEDGLLSDHVFPAIAEHQ